MKNNVQLEAIPLFSCPVFITDSSEFLGVTRKIAKKFIAKRKKETEINPNYPVYMTESINYDPEMQDFANFVAKVAWDILDSQGYMMSIFNTYFAEMWAQEHHQHSTMEKHIHGNGAVISGFYFLDVPKDSSRVIFHDPKDAKVITNLPEKNMLEGTHASCMINFVPKEGQLMITNSWLPHSFTKNTSKKPLRFIHFNIAVAQAKEPQICNKAQPEVI
jgi:uncharacterized protein (TIGR02466 family)